STFEVNTRLRPMPVAPRGLDQDMSTVTVAGLGDRAESLPVTTRVLAGDESEIARELGGPLETAPVDDLRRQHHRRVQGDATEALQLAHHRREGRELGQLLDLPIQLVAPLQLVHQQRMVLAEHELICRGEG